MTTKRGSITFAIPLPVATDPASLERLGRVITDAHAAIGTFTATIAGLGGSAAYKPKGERKGRAAPAMTTSTDDHAGPALHGPSPTLDAGEVTLHDGEPGLAAQRLAAADHFNIPKVLRK